MYVYRDTIYTICNLHTIYNIYIYTISCWKQYPLANRKDLATRPCDETLRRDLATTLRRTLRRGPCDEGHVCSKHVATTLRRTLRRSLVTHRLTHLPVSTYVSTYVSTSSCDGNLETPCDKIQTCSEHVETPCDIFELDRMSFRYDIVYYIYIYI